jgi:hypothetical protein
MVRATHNVTKYCVMVEGWKKVASEAIVILLNDGVQSLLFGLTVVTCTRCVDRASLHCNALHRHSIRIKGTLRYLLQGGFGVLLV